MLFRSFRVCPGAWLNSHKQFAINAHGKNLWRSAKDYSLRHLRDPLDVPSSAGPPLAVSPLTVSLLAESPSAMPLSVMSPLAIPLLAGPSLAYWLRFLQLDLLHPSLQRLYIFRRDCFHLHLFHLHIFQCCFFHLLKIKLLAKQSLDSILSYKITCSSSYQKAAKGD